jgi:type I restriction enzyme R subunit
MTPHGRDWNEINLSENPAVELLEKLGFTYVAPEVLEAERETLKETVVVGRLAKALKKLNPWISDDNARKVARSVANVPAASLIEASEKVYTTLTYGVGVEQDGEPTRNVRFFDFERPANNEWIVTRQYTVKGVKKHCRPDVVLLANGIPLAVIECKSPTLGEGWKLEAIDQLTRYQEQDDKYRELGIPRLFETAQVLVATCGQAAAYGTTTTPHRFFAEWKTPWPLTTPRLRDLLGREPTIQDVTIAGLLAPANLLDLMRNFVVFERDAATGRTIRKLCRYQQFMAVNKAIERAGRAKTPSDRGGVVWHTQGSGKSLTMLWLALKLRRDPLHENPTLVIVTDRKDLDEQITKTFVACGFPNPEQAESVRDLRALLSGPPGKTVLTTVQKFQELAGPGNGGKKRVTREEFPTLNEARNIFVLTDEAHRTQYGGPSGQHAAGSAQRRLLRVHGDADRQERPLDALHLRPVHRHVHDRAGRRRRRDGARSSTRVGSPSFASSAIPSTPSSTASSPIEARRSGRRSRRSTGPSRPSRERRSESRPSRSTSSTTTRNSSVRTGSRRRSSAARGRSPSSTRRRSTASTDRSRR